MVALDQTLMRPALELRLPNWLALAASPSAPQSRHAGAGMTTPAVSSLRKLNRFEELRQAFVEVFDALHAHAGFDFLVDRHRCVRHGGQ
jgi:hypothetical protein